MSRIGKQPINIPTGVKVSKEGNLVSVTGPQGTLSLQVRDDVGVAIEGDFVKVTKKADTKTSEELHGLTRTLIANMVHGVSKGFEKRLEITGVGYKAEVKGGAVNFSLGYSHPIVYQLPKGIAAAMEKQTSLTLKGADKYLVGQVAAEIRSLRPPDSYKGKGVRYEGEVITLKAGKAGKAAGGA
ncbi:MAG: 50S ribosomal protein L6 [Deltaproteobacteria bacterium]|nr:50S ribosomal protein L6 [Deltaproteobacteria bacterium]